MSYRSIYCVSIAPVFWRAWIFVLFVSVISLCLLSKDGPFTTLFLLLSLSLSLSLIMHLCVSNGRTAVWAVLRQIVVRAAFSALTSCW